ncbi:sensor histidine kinase [Halobacteriovorax sp. HLS]|uniref:sensor histidine kinase n=1 Tax=Halobacteriovorax sp. HLS TaxID=2234000 RepID=UPI000FD8ED5E|nr:HAMP domain-containing sensor histidine kinase [Halobacteriovorax sp. HLS]
MENKGNTRTKKIKRPLKLYISDSIQAGIFKPAENITLSQTPLNSDYSIHCTKGTFEVFQGNSILGKPLFKTSSSTFYKTIYQLIRSNEDLQKDEFKGFTKKKSLKVNHLRKVTSNNIRSLYEILEFKTYMISQSKKISSTKELPEYILKSKLYKSYSSCQIMIHQKGSPSISAYCYDETLGPTQKEILVTNFSKIFNLVKKSKNKLFDQSSLLETDIGVVGTFLAKEIELSKHSILIFISRNDFLPPSDIEIGLFNSSMSFISDVVQDILLTSLEKQRSELYSSFIQHYPHPVFLDENPLNISAREIELLEQEEADKYIDVNEKKLVELYKTQQKDTSDIYHHQRISLLGELLNTLKHELSNPLFGLKMASDLLLLEDGDDEFKTTVNDISINSNRCQTIIDNFSKLYREENIFEEFNISDVIKETILLTKSESKQIPKKIDFYNFQVEKDYIINSNPTWLSQIIFNLVINSSQAIKSSGTNLSTNKIDISIIKRLEEIEISISDTGPGIPDKYKSKVFDAFYTSKSKGTGLGLSICANLIDKLHGKIEIIDRDECGTIVIFTLPIEDNYANSCN